MNDRFVCHCDACDGRLPEPTDDFTRRDPEEAAFAPIVELQYVPLQDAPAFCYRCGSRQVAIVRDDYAICEPCETDYQARLAAEFPFGQCQTCGIAGSRELPAWIAGPHHVEGACGLWADRDDDDRLGFLGDPAADDQSLDSDPNDVDSDGLPF